MFLAALLLIGLMFSILGKNFGRQHFDFFFFFPRKWTLTFHAYCLLCMKCQYIS